MEQASEYTVQANKFLVDSDIEFSAVLVGNDCPRFCEDALEDRDMDKIEKFPRKTHIHGKHYRCTFQRRGHTTGKEASGHFGVLSIDFWNSYTDEEENFFVFYRDKYRIGGKYPRRPRAKKRIVPRAKKRIVPQPYDVLACITKDDPGTFDDFCGEYRYDADSRKLESIYHAVVKEWRKVRDFFSDAELDQIREIQ